MSTTSRLIRKSYRTVVDAIRLNAINTIISHQKHLHTTSQSIETVVRYNRSQTTQFQLQKSLLILAPSAQCGILSSYTTHLLPTQPLAHHILAPSSHSLTHSSWSLLSQPDTISSPDLLSSYRVSVRPMSTSSSSSQVVASTSAPVGAHGCPVRDRSKYKRYREDFGPLATKPLHMDLTFDMTETRVLVNSIGTYVHHDDTPLDILVLDSNNIEIQEIAFLPPNVVPKADERPNQNDWDKHINAVNLQADKFVILDSKNYAPKDDADYKTKLQVKLPQSINKGDQFILRTRTICHPTAHILEGIYFDYTPEGCPKTMITQCQQYGFQRIVPSIDQMPSKMCYTTSIIADSRYVTLSSLLLPLTRSITNHTINLLCLTTLLIVHYTMLCNLYCTSPKL